MAREAEAVDGDGHRVRGEVAGAGPGPRTGDTLELVQLRALDQTSFLRAERLPHVADRHLAAAQAPGAHRAAVEDDGGLVDASERHQRGGHGLVTADQAHERVEIMRPRHQLDRVGDHLARDQRRTHPGRALRLVVGDGDRVELERHTAGGGHARGDVLGELALVQVAGHRPRPRGRDADDGPVEAGRVDAHGAEVGARRRALGAARERSAGAASRTGV